MKEITLDENGKYNNLDIDCIMKILPHRYPILLIDRVVQVDPSKSIIAYKNVTINEQIFLGHFPKEPVYPGVMIIEGMAQAGGILAFISAWGFDYSKVENKIIYFMTIDDVKFRIPVRPGDKLEYHIELTKFRLGAKSVCEFKALAIVDSNIACEANLKAMLLDRHT